MLAGDDPVRQLLAGRVVQMRGKRSRIHAMPDLMLRVAEQLDGVVVLRVDGGKDQECRRRVTSEALWCMHDHRNARALEPLTQVVCSLAGVKGTDQLHDAPRAFSTTFFW